MLRIESITCDYISCRCNLVINGKIACITLYSFFFAAVHRHWCSLTYEKWNELHELSRLEEISCTFFSINRAFIIQFYTAESEPVIGYAMWFRFCFFLFLALKDDFSVNFRISKNCTNNIRFFLDFYHTHTHTQ